MTTKKIKNITYSEPADFIPEKLRKEHKLGEFNELCGGIPVPERIPEENQNEYLEDCGGLPVIEPIPEKKNNLTEIVFILDRSGSMSGLEKDTIGGFNSLIDKQKKEEGQAFISTVLFDNHSEVLHDRVSIDKIQPMTDKEYFVRGCTALLDAIGGAIHHIGNVHKYAREEDRPSKTLFIITTDGMENASRRYTADKVKSMIERQKEKYGWEFLFLGANIDAVSTASKFGIERDMAVDYNCDGKGTALNYEVLNETISHVRCSSAPIDKSWKRRIEEDYNKRSK